MAKAGNTNHRGGGAHVGMHSPSVVRMMQSQPPADGPGFGKMPKLDRRTRIRAFVAAVLVMALLASVVCLGLANGSIGFRTIPPASEQQALTTRGFLEVAAQADGWDAESSTKLIIACRDQVDGSTRYHAMDANGRETVELEAGEYLLGCISPVDADGSIYLPPEERPVSVAAGHTSNETVVLVKVPPEDVSRDEYLAILDAVRIAVEQGDESLQGDSGWELLDRVVAHVEASPGYYEPVPYLTWDYAYSDTYSYDWYDSYDPTPEPSAGGAPEEGVHVGAQGEPGDAAGDATQEGGLQSESAAADDDNPPDQGGMQASSSQGSAEAGGGGTPVNPAASTGSQASGAGKGSRSGAA